MYARFLKFSNDPSKRPEVEVVADKVLSVSILLFLQMRARMVHSVYGNQKTMPIQGELQFVRK
jgi:hypothetical protein